MDYTHLGRSGLSVSRLCLGTMNFGWKTEEADAHAIMDRAHAEGVNFFDTANVYGFDAGKGRTEEVLGTWFAQGGERREKTVLATKVYGSMTDWPNDTFLSARNIVRACEASLRRMQTDWIDLYQFHHVDLRTPWEEIWQACETLVAQGKVLYVGSSNHAAWQLAAANEAAARRNFQGLVSEQSHYNLLTRHVELEVLPAAEHYGVGDHPVEPAGRRPARRRAGEDRGRTAQRGAQPEAGREAPPRPGAVRGVLPRARRRRRPTSGWPGCCTSRRSPRRSSARARWSSSRVRWPPSTSSWTTRPWPGWTRSSRATSPRPWSTPGESSEPRPEAAEPVTRWASATSRRAASGRGGSPAAAPRSPATPARGSRPAGRSAPRRRAGPGRHRPRVRCGRNGRSSTGRPRRPGRGGQPVGQVHQRADVAVQTGPGHLRTAQRAEPPAAGQPQGHRRRGRHRRSRRGRDQRRHALLGHPAEEQQGEVPALRAPSSAGRRARRGAGPARGRGRRARPAGGSTAKKMPAARRAQALHRQPGLLQLGEQPEPLDVAGRPVGRRPQLVRDLEQQRRPRSARRRRRRPAPAGGPWARRPARGTS